MTTFVLVANASEARLFARKEKYGELSEVKDFLHPESRLSGKELEHDRQGSRRESPVGQGSKAARTEGHATSSQSKDTEPKTREAEDFARDLADMLGTARGRGDFEHLVLVADPSFLGKLRDALDAETRSAVVAGIDKNIVHADPDAIRETVNEAV
ncbi:MAG: host attachment protein [Wenzhouxiangellaceae bacterium]|nr:host attachment protein [Wenzhouxiangellaceae bacterium]